MKYIIVIIVFAYIICAPSDIPIFGSIFDRIKDARKKRFEKIIECTNEKGSETLKNLFKNNKEMKVGKIIKDNKDSLTEKDKQVFHECRKQLFSNLKFLKKELKEMDKV